MVNKKYNRVYFNRDKFTAAMDELGLSVTQLASQLFISGNTIHYRMNNGWKKFDAEIVAKFLKVKTSDLI